MLFLIIILYFNECSIHVEMAFKKWMKFLHNISLFPEKVPANSSWSSKMRELDIGTFEFSFNPKFNFLQPEVTHDLSSKLKFNMVVLRLLLFQFTSELSTGKSTKYYQVPSDIPMIVPIILYSLHIILFLHIKLLYMYIVNSPLLWVRNAFSASDDDDPCCSLLAFDEEDELEKS